MGKTNGENKIGYIIVCIFVSFIVLVLILPFLFIPIVSKEQKQEIIDTFAGYESSGEVRYHDGLFIFLPDKRIDIRSIKYNETECQYVLSCGANSFYTYTKEVIDRTHMSLHLLEISYADNEITHIDTLSNLPNNSSFSNFCIDNKFYFGIFDGCYYVYDLDERAYTTLPEAEVATLREAQSQYEFNVLDNKKLINKKYYGLEIIDKSSLEKKTITLADLSGFSEGQYILSIKPYLTNLFFRRAIEKGGDIYILGMIMLDTIAGMKHQTVVLKYNFESDQLSYYSSMHLSWDEPPLMVIL